MPVMLVLMLLCSSAMLAITASAVDGDNDGIDDAVDDCPFAWGNSTIGYAGCPDSDGDGNPNFAGATITDWEDSARALYVSDGSSRAISWAPDSVHVAGGGGSDVILYTAGGATIATLYTFTDEYVRALAFSPNGSYLAAGAYFNDGDNHSQIVVLEMDWTTKTATLLKNLSDMHFDDVPSVAWSSNGSYLFTGGGEGELRQFSANENWSMVSSYSFDPGDGVWSVDVSPDDRLVAGLAAGGELKTFWTNNGTEHMYFNNHTSNYALSVTFSPDGRWLLTGAFDNRVNIYNVSNASHVGGFTDSSRDVYSISFDPTGAYFVVAGGDDEVRVYDSPDNVANFSNYSNEIARFGSFSGGGGGGGSSRGVRAVAWSPDGDKMAFAQMRGRSTVYMSPETFHQLKGDITGELMIDRWQENWPSTDGRPISHKNMTTTLMSNTLCNDGGIVGSITHGVPHHIATPVANWSTSGLLNCTQTTSQLLEVPIGRMPASLFVQSGGAAESCLSIIGGLSMAQLRWILSGASLSTLVQSGEMPGIELMSVVPNLDSDGRKEWGDLHPSCSQEPFHVAGRWDNRSVPMMMERLFTCSDCQFPDGFFVSSTARFRFEEELRSSLVYFVSQQDDLLGFTEMRVALDSPDLYHVPVVDNWTHGAQDALAAGGQAVQPSVSASENGTWPVQDDHNLIIDSAEVQERLQLLEWMLNDTAQAEWDDMGFVRLSLYARVSAWARIGVDARYLLPDDDNDGVWNGEDDCADTLQGWVADERGCAQYQLDDDGDGFANSDDDCITQWGNSTVPTFGCPDADGDGVADTDDDFPDEPTQWLDSDEDGYGDNQTLGAWEPDSCPGVSGTSHYDRFGCPDTDGDGWSDEDSEWLADDGADAFPLDHHQWVDTDGDGYGDNHSYFLDNDGLLRVDERGDAWPDDPFKWSDTDGDGFADQQMGTQPDSCPLQAGTSTEIGRVGCPDSDGDGFADIDDDFPDEPTQWEDADGDGYGDRWEGNNPDDCIETPPHEIDDVNDDGCGPSERDSDFDGINDAYDDCPDTPTSEVAMADWYGCSDSQRDDDGDGVNNPDDDFPHDPTQTRDTDGDGMGDNSSGTNGDDCRNRVGNSTGDRRGCPDSDGDGFSDPDSLWRVSDGADALIYDSTQWVDSDGDGFYDNWDDPEWNSSRQYGWPGEFIPGATAPDKCPADSSSLANGCPTEIWTGPATEGGGSSSGLPAFLWVAIALAIMVIVGLVVAVTVNTRRPKRKRASGGKLDQALQVVDEAAGSWAEDASEGVVTEDYEAPHEETQGEVADDGVEWLEWPENSDVWWFRDESGYWVPHK